MSLDALKDIASGTVGGFVQVAAGHPLDTLKVRLQTQVSVPGQPLQFNGMMDCLQQTVRNEGVAGLFKGAASPLAGAVGMNAALFFGYGQGKHIVAKYIFTEEQADHLSIKGTFVAAAIAGVMQSLVASPQDLLKIKLQAQVGSGQYSGVFDCARQIASKYGVRGLYQGLQGTVIRDVPCYASQFAMFEYMRRNLHTGAEGPPTFTANFLAGGVSGFAFWAPFYPLEVIKSRLQGDALVKAEAKYTGWWDCAVKTSRGGTKELYKGFLPCLVRAGPVNAFIFSFVVGSKQLLDEYI